MDLMPDGEGFIVKKTCFYSWQNSCINSVFNCVMKKMAFLLMLGFLLSCGNESAENKPTDLDRTKNNDTDAVKRDSSTIIKTDSIGATHL